MKSVKPPLPVKSWSAGALACDVLMKKCKAASSKGTLFHSRHGFGFSISAILAILALLAVS
jgi:hypothetical protein